MEPLLALDFASVRRVDADGHMHVAASTITEACVSPYLGREIVDWQRLGLDPTRVYRLLRDPEELRLAADSFSGKPLLTVHKPQTAEDHAHRLTVGAVTAARFDPATGRLVAALDVWDGDAIRSIQDGRQRFLSCGYRYAPDMTPGTYRGQAYDGVMRGIAGNHVALVDSPRVPTAFVGDSLPSSLRTPRGPRNMMIMDADYVDQDDPIERVLTTMRESGFTEDHCKSARETLARMLQESADATNGVPQQAADRAAHRAAFEARFPQARRLSR